MRSYGHFDRSVSRPAGRYQGDVSIVGGADYTGLPAALHLAEAGFDAVLPDAYRVGFGASGRNGGQLGSAQQMDQEDLEHQVGDDDAAKLRDLAEDAK